MQNMSKTVELTLKQALHIAQNSQSEEIDPRVLAVLEAGLKRIWRDVLARPNTYVMTKLEFGVFNRYRARPEYQNETARKAVSRYWDSGNGK